MLHHTDGDFAVVVLILMKTLYLQGFTFLVPPLLLPPHSLYFTPPLLLPLHSLYFTPPLLLPLPPPYPYRHPAPLFTSPTPPLLFSLPSPLFAPSPVILRTFTRNIRERRGSKIVINVPSKHKHQNSACVCVCDRACVLACVHAYMCVCSIKHAPVTFLYILYIQLQCIPSISFGILLRLTIYELNCWLHTKIKLGQVACDSPRLSKGTCAVA